MLIWTKCPCGQENQSEALVSWAKDGSMPVLCSKCSNIYVATKCIKVKQDSLIEENTEDAGTEDTNTENTRDTDAENTGDTDKDTLINKDVKIENHNHESHGKYGTIIDYSNGHYKVQIKNGKSIWIPQNWAVFDKPQSSKITKKSEKIAKIMVLFIMILAMYGFVMLSLNIWSMI